MILTKTLLVLLFGFINIILAKIDAEKIKQNKRIYHGINGLIYGALVAIAFYFVRSYALIFALLCERRIVFDTALNIFRGLRFDYISSKTTSIIDRISYKFQSKYGYFVYYAIFFVILVICIFLNF